MKTKIFQIGVLAASLFSFCACNLDYAPENTLVDEKVYKTQKTAEAALLGAYVRLNVFWLVRLKTRITMLMQAIPC